MAERTAKRGGKAVRPKAIAALQSMTGFARAEGAFDGARWAWEIKSVNARHLDVRMRLPNGFDALEPRARALARERFARGTLAVHLALERARRAPDVRVNEPVLDKLLAIHDALRRRLDAPPARLESIMALPGVLEIQEDEGDGEAREPRLEAMIASFGDALDALAVSRREEGARLATLIEGHLGEIAALSDAAAGIADAEPEAFRARVREQLRDLLGAEAPLSQDRLTQEVAHLAGRADVREEIDRLASHAQAARALVGAGGAIGRKLDFLCQEFGREANTLCSKSANLDLTRVGLDLKAAIERLREQVQNVE